jgi:3-deoxy-manno-octulosonate cytidylyltransferase (CMP-KDO synthetase)
MGVVGVIPARLQSTRLPRKLLLAETGKPLIQYVWEAASRSKSLDRVLVATDSEEIADVVRGFGGDVEMTGEHPSGTDRIAEVIRRRPDLGDIVVNLQGDEPELSPELVETLVKALLDHSTAEMSTLGTPLSDKHHLDSPSVVKIARGRDGRALYFSRLPIPYVRDGLPEEAAVPWLQHLGLYAYRRDFLLWLATLPPSPLEQLEKLEQLRALEAGARIQVAVVLQPSVGIDTPEDYARFVERLRGKTA